MQVGDSQHIGHLPGVLDPGPTRPSGDLRAPPSNRLEKLKGEREGQHSIRINHQWRVCFRWTESGAEAVDVVDYH
jgi:plasmid maintenance system killer protein